MASSKEGGKLMQEIHDQFLICKICYEAYKRPKTLVCLHTFCTECLEKHMDAEMERSYRYLLYARMVTCPICRQKTEIPTGGIKRLPDNFLVTNLNQIMSRRRPNSKIPACGICQQSTTYTHKDAVSKCLDCSKFLCKSCVDLHLRTKVTKTHSLIDVEDEKDIECKAHNDEIVRFYCEPCEMCICVLCTFQEHKGHEVSSFTEGLTKYRHSLDGLVSACRERVSALRERLDRITHCETIIRQAEEQIRDTAINSISAIRKKERQMIQDLMGAFGQESLEFIKEKEPIQDAIDNLVSTCSLTDIILKDKGIELLLLKKEIQEKLQLLLNYDLVPTPNDLDKSVTFLPGKMVFGYLRVDSDPPTPMADDEMYSSVTGCDVIMQTDGLSMEDRCTSIGGLFPYCDHTILSASTQTDALINGHAAARECHTMTDSIEVVKRKVQTEPMQVSALANGDILIDTTDRSTNTSCVGMCTRSTLTMQKPTHDQPTGTEDLIKSHDKLCETRQIIQANSYTITDVVPIVNKSTLTDTPTMADKLTWTSRIVQKDECSNTPVVIYLDMGVNAKMEGEDKAINTRTIVTMDSSTGESNAHVHSTGTATHEKGLRLANVATSYDAVEYRSRACSPAHLLTCDQANNTVTPQLISQASSTDKTQLLTQETMCDIPAVGTDIAPVISPTYKTCSSQTTVSHLEDITGSVLLSHTEGLDTEMVDMCVGSDDVMTGECDTQTDLTSSLHPIDYVPFKVFRDGSTMTMYSRGNDMKEAATSTLPAETADSGCMTTPAATITTSTNTSIIAHHQSDQSTNTQQIVSREEGCNTPRVITQNQNTCTESVATKDTGMMALALNADKATYMPQPVITATGTNTPTVHQADKRVNTARVETRDWGSLTYIPKRMIDQGLMTVEIPRTVRGTNTVRVTLSDRAVDAFHGDRADMWTLAKPLMRDNITEMVKTPLRDSGCNPVRHATVENGTCMGSVVVCDSFTSTATVATREVGTLKRPEGISRGMETTRTKTTDNFTVMPTITTQDSACNTPGTVDIEKFNSNDIEKKTFMERAMQTVTASYQERSASPVRVSFGEDKGVGVQVEAHERGSSPINLVQTTDRGTGHDSTFSERATSPVHVATATTFTNTITADRTNRGCSPTQTAMVDKETSVVRTEVVHCGTSTVKVVSASVSCGDSHWQMTERATTPIKIVTHEQAAMTCVETAEGQTETDVVTLSDGSTSTVPVRLHDTATSMPQVDYLEKETSTPLVAVLHKNVYTDLIQTLHAYTSTEPAEPPTVSTTSTGTSTQVIDSVERATSPQRTLLVEKATSPVRVIRLDKGISVNRAELVAPVESFQRAGAIRKLITPGEECNEPLFIPRLTAIREDSKESSSDEEGVARNRMLTELSQSSIVQMEQLWSASSSGKKTDGTNMSTFTAHGSSQTSTILCRVETGTSTPPIEMEDKAISTESFVGNGKMAECISKLRSVTQRLESQSTYGSLSQASPPIYSKANISGHQSANAPSSRSTRSTVPMSTGGSAITTVTTVHSGSKLVGDSVSEASPFTSPIIGRKCDSLEEAESPSLRRKARKQRLDISQLLRSSAADLAAADPDSPPPFAMGRPRLQPVYAQVIPNIGDVIRKSPRPPRRRKSDGVKQRSSDEQSMHSESSHSSQSSHSSPERLKERLQRLPPAFDSSSRKSKEKHSGRSRSDKHRDRLHGQVGVAEGREGTKSTMKSRDLTPPAPMPQLALMRRPRKSELKLKLLTENSPKMKGLSEADEDSSPESPSSHGKQVKH